GDAAAALVGGRLARRERGIARAAQDPQHDVGARSVVDAEAAGAGAADEVGGGGQEAVVDGDGRGRRDRGSTRLARGAAGRRRRITRGRGRSEAGRERGAGVRAQRRRYERAVVAGRGGDG